MSNPQRPASEPLSRNAFFVGALLLIAAFSLHLAPRFAPFAGGSDSSGYLNQAKLIAAGTWFAEPRVPEDLRGLGLSPHVFTPLGFTPSEDGTRLIPTYPPGLSLHLAAAAQVVGWERAPLLVSWLGAVAGGLVFLLLGRQWELGRAWALAALAALLFCPLLVFLAVQPMSDVLAMTWGMAALYLAGKSRQGRAWEMALVGFALAVSVLVRPTNLLLAPALLVAGGVDLRRLLWLIVGGAPGAAYFFVHGQTLFGNPFATGYGNVNGLFGAKWILPTLLHFGHWGFWLLSPAVAVAVAGVLVWKGEARRVLVLAAWILPLTLLYSAYIVSHETWWYLRFLLPVFPALLLAGFGSWQRLSERLGERWPAVRRRGTTLALAGAVGASAVAVGLGQAGKLGVDHVRLHEEGYQRLAQWALAHLPPESLLLTLPASGSLYYYTEFAFARSDELARGGWPAVAEAVRARGRPVYLILFPYEQAENRWRRELPGDWEHHATVSGIEIWRLRP